MPINTQITTSQVVSLQDCPCEVPVILSTLYEGQTIIPFSLNMADGTEVIEIYSGATTKILEGYGVIELPLAINSFVQLQVNSESCKSLSCEQIVLGKNYCEQGNCYLEIVNLEFEIVQGFAKIKKLDILSSEKAEYKISGEWVNSWIELPFFELNTHHFLEVRAGECSVQENIYVEQKIINVPTPVGVLVPNLVPTVVSVPSTVQIPTPTRVNVEVPTPVSIQVLLAVNVPTPVSIPQLTPVTLIVPTPIAVPTAVPTNTPISVPVDTPTAVPTPVSTPSAVPSGVPTPVNTPIAVPTEVFTPVEVPTPVTVLVPSSVPTPIAVPSAVPTVCPTPIAVPVNTPVALLNAQITIIKRPTCLNGTNGALGLKVTGGTAPYTYAWTRNGVSVGSATQKNRGFVNNSGLWQVVITDNLGQTLTKSVNLFSKNTSSLTQSYPITPPSSMVSSDGSITVSGSGGTAPYLYYWLDNETTSNSRTGLSEGVIVLKTIDSNQCNTGNTIIGITSSVAGFRDIVNYRSVGRNCQWSKNYFF